VPLRKPNLHDLRAFVRFRDTFIDLGHFTRLITRPRQDNFAHRNLPTRTTRLRHFLRFTIFLTPPVWLCLNSHFFAKPFIVALSFFVLRFLDARKKKYPRCFFVQGIIPHTHKAFSFEFCGFCVWAYGDAHLLLYVLSTLQPLSHGKPFLMHTKSFAPALSEIFYLCN
jgi:hypothetical protein